MNDQILQDIERELQPFAKDTSPHYLGKFPTAAEQLGIQEPISEITRRIDRSDVHRQAEQFNALLLIETDTAIEQLRHRAQMMRDRASEFDKLADDMANRQEKLIVSIGYSLEQYEHAKTLIATHAHIKPTEVT